MGTIAYPGADSSVDLDIAPASRQPRIRPKMLLIEDEPLAVKYVTKVMQSKGINVEAPQSLDELRRLYPKLEQFRIILLDINLSHPKWGVRGPQLLHEMLAVSDQPMVIIWTAYGHTQEALDCINAGASLVVRKNGNAESLANLLNRIEVSYEELAQAGYPYEG